MLTCSEEGEALSWRRGGGLPGLVLLVCGGLKSGGEDRLCDKVADPIGGLWSWLSQGLADTSIEVSEVPRWQQHSVRRCITASGRIPNTRSSLLSLRDADETKQSSDP